MGRDLRRVAMKYNGARNERLVMRNDRLNCLACEHRVYRYVRACIYMNFFLSLSLECLYLSPFQLQIENIYVKSWIESRANGYVRGDKFLNFFGS